MQLGRLRWLCRLPTRANTAGFAAVAATFVDLLTLLQKQDATLDHPVQLGWLQRMHGMLHNTSN